ncbi:histidine phosphatase family protein [Mycolicibacterium brumae]|uniref:histidine phosphatase family protein n=1 Tax=Mycolicibacterium brumae TaxID=85968 RepID=UPI000ABF48EB|nr:histidine phosphatase family protein [Mycolicibacterium brumae]
MSTSGHGRLLLVRHGQSWANVERSLDTRPPGAELTPLGREQARAFALGRPQAPALLVHSVAVRAAQTAGEISTVAGMGAVVAEGVHEVQAGELEGRNDEPAHAEFARVYQHWHTGALDVAMPGGESGAQVLERFLPVVGELRSSYLEADGWAGDIVLVSHGAAIRLVAAALTGVDPGFAVDRHLANTEAVALAPVTDGRWSCLQWGPLTPPFGPDAPANTAPADPAPGDPMG